MLCAAMGCVYRNRQGQPPSPSPPYPSPMPYPASLPLSPPLSSSSSSNSCDMITSLTPSTVILSLSLIDPADAHHGHLVSPRLIPFPSFHLPSSCCIFPTRCYTTENLTNDSGALLRVALALALAWVGRCQLPQDMGGGAGKVAYIGESPFIPLASLQASLHLQLPPPFPRIPVSSTLLDQS